MRWFTSRPFVPWLVLAVSLVALLAGGYSLAAAERVWPVVPAYESNLSYGPVPPGGAVEQTFPSPPSPMRRVDVWLLDAEPGQEFVMRLLEPERIGSKLWVDRRVAADESGRVSLEIPGTVAPSADFFAVQVVNPLTAGDAVTVQANRTDPYPAGRGAIYGDPGTGRNDLVFQIWRRITPRVVLAEALAAPGIGRAFLIGSGVAGLLLVGWTASWVARRGGRQWVWAASTSVSGLALMVWIGRLGFETLAAWLP